MTTTEADTARHPGELARHGPHLMWTPESTDALLARMRTMPGKRVADDDLEAPGTLRVGWFRLRGALEPADIERARVFKFYQGEEIEIALLVRRALDSMLKQPPMPYTDGIGLHYEEPVGGPAWALAVVVEGVFVLGRHWPERIPLERRMFEGEQDEDRAPRPGWPDGVGLDPDPAPFHELAGPFPSSGDDGNPSEEVRSAEDSPGGPEHRHSRADSEAPTDRAPSSLGATIAALAKAEREPSTPSSFLTGWRVLAYGRPVTVLALVELERVELCVDGEVYELTPKAARALSEALALAADATGVAP